MASCRPPGPRRSIRLHLALDRRIATTLRWGLLALPVVAGLALPGPPAWAQGEVVVANMVANSVTVYRRTATGDVAPLRTLSGASTGLSGPVRVVVDPVHDELVVANQGSDTITVYPRTATGNVAPLRTLTGPATGLSDPTGLFVDTVHDELLVGNLNNTITVYPRAATGNVAPLRTLGGSATGLGSPVGLFVDTAHDELLVANVANSVTAYSRTATGDVAPLRTISGAATSLGLPHDLAVDLVHDEILVANRLDHSVRVYSRTATGNVAPLRTLGGPSTGLNGPEGIALDRAHDELLVVNVSVNSVTVYPRTAAGDVAPLRTLTGAATGLIVPRHVSVAIAAVLGRALEVDAAGNGVLEPGETAGVAPTWQNLTGPPVTLSGTASGFTGPPGAAYSIVDGSAEYGAVAAGDSRSCATTANCYTLSVSAPATRPLLHWDAVFQEMPATVEDLATEQPRTWTVHVGESFTDVPPSHQFYGFIETLLHVGVTAGCSPDGYCPDSTTTREQMAVFLLRAREGASYAPPPCTISSFADVPCGSPFAPWIQELVTRGITAGCGGGLYCPGNPVTREQMAVFLIRTKEGAAFTPPPCATAPFSDVPCGSPFAPWVRELAVRGITAGCGAALYCPTAPVTRGQMAVFLTKTFTLRRDSP
jgi:DNA-binding beta-propeller fold protein YncE